MKRIVFILLVFLCIAVKSYAQKPVFNHIALMVTDARTSAAFYMKWFHLDSIGTPFTGSATRWLSLGNGMQLHLIQVSKSNHIAFSVPSIDSFIALLKKDGITFSDGGKKTGTYALRPDGVKQVYFHDPDGYELEVNDAH
jgi:lactoylglutathione lyase